MTTWEQSPRNTFHPGQEISIRSAAPLYVDGEWDRGQFGADHQAIMDSHPVEETEKLLLRTDYLGRDTKICTDELRSRIVGPADTSDSVQGERSAERLRTIDAAIADLIENGEGDALRAQGFDFGQAWPVDVAARIVQNKPILFYAVTGQADSQAYPLNSHVPPEQSGLEHMALGRALRRVSRLAPGCQVITLNDHIDIRTGYKLNSLERYEYARGIEESLRETEIVPLFSRDGRDYFMRPASIVAERIHDLGAALRCGQVAPGNTHFKPDASFLREHGIPSDTRRSRLLSEGVQLRNQDGTPTKAALLACQMLDRINTQYMHVFIADIRDKDAYEDAYLLLCTMSRAYHTMFRPFYVDFENSPPDVADYGVMRALELGNGMFQSNLERYANAPHMQLSEVLEYYREEYGSGALGKNEYGVHGDDLEGAKTIVPLLPGLFPKGIGSIAVPGYGLYSWLAQAVTPHLLPDTLIDATDVAPANIATMLNYKEGTLSDEFMAIGPKFGRLLLDLGGERYGQKPEDSDALLRARLLPGYGDITKLRKGAYQVIIDSFVSYAICTTLGQYYEIVQAEADALNEHPEATLISLCVVGRKNGWRRYPAVNLPSEEVIRQAHRDAGLDRVKIIPIKTDDKFHDGYSHVALVIARRSIHPLYFLTSIAQTRPNNKLSRDLF